MHQWQTDLQVWHTTLTNFRDPKKRAALRARTKNGLAWKKQKQDDKQKQNASLEKDSTPIGSDKSNLAKDSSEDAKKEHGANLNAAKSLDAEQSEKHLSGKADEDKTAQPNGGTKENSGAVESQNVAPIAEDDKAKEDKGTADAKVEETVKDEKVEVKDEKMDETVKDEKVEEKPVDDKAEGQTTVDKADEKAVGEKVDATESPPQADDSTKNESTEKTSEKSADVDMKNREEDLQKEDEVDLLQKLTDDLLQAEKDVFLAPDVCNIRDGKPLFSSFSFEDWALLSLRFEIHLMIHSFRKDSKKNPDINPLQIAICYNMYFKKVLNPINYGMRDMDEVLAMIDDTVVASSEAVDSQLTDSLHSNDIFVRLTEEGRRVRQRRIDGGDQAAVLKFVNQRPDVPAVGSVPPPPPPRLGMPMFGPPGNPLAGSQGFMNNPGKGNAVIAGVGLQTVGRGPAKGNNVNPLMPPPCMGGGKGDGLNACGKGYMSKGGDAMGGFGKGGCSGSGCKGMPGPPQAPWVHAVGNYGKDACGKGGWGCDPMAGCGKGGCGMGCNMGGGLNDVGKGAWKGGMDGMMPMGCPAPQKGMDQMMYGKGFDKGCDGGFGKGKPMPGFDKGFEKGARASPYPQQSAPQPWIMKGGGAPAW